MNNITWTFDDACKLLKSVAEKDDDVSDIIHDDFSYLDEMSESYDKYLINKKDV